MPKYTEVFEYAQTCIQAHVPCLIRGAPGVGKSSLIKQLASEMGIGFVDIRAAMLDPVDILGIPVPNREERTVEWLTPDFWQQEGAGIFCRFKPNDRPSRCWSTLEPFQESFHSYYL